ncbi:Phosphotransferase enzyme family protein [Actinopolymorpha cephalotaxi]|uniref:Aminoglycoside phosphotransferase (APT) family kinase protein n=1 Tax=Actinopolymorpha cephalotaxi TaxID=504797 RepID=A0A1I2YNJ4_9ACTN|nr:phosphotransferase [Actinopolymorpha cephalotaxi]NYH86860.1 aminoglycoside phosphotransferase (APT) family kinase protein [Actinopolymorpha cephalotaxi]SFH27244.1 Phosphotransferase enzyme family protein [Actinopolymorpha cephalotaxi]
MDEHPLEFTLSENPWAPTKVVAEINQRTGDKLELTGLSDQVGGVSSAAYVRWPDGRAGVVTRPTIPLAYMHLTAEILRMVRAHGLPVPRYDVILQLADGMVTVVQERLPGKHVTRFSAGLIEEMVATNERFAGLLADRPDVPPPPQFPRLVAGEHPWEETLGRYDERSRRILERFLEIDDGEPFEMTGDDVVHTDFSFGNVLFDDHGTVSAVVDWNFGIARGDRRFALLDMRDNLVIERRSSEGFQEAVDRLDEILAATLGEDLLRIYRIHRSVHSVHRSISNGFRPEKIEYDLEAAQCRLDGTTPPPHVW